MAVHSSILAWRILWPEEPGRLQYRERVTQSRTRLKQLHACMLLMGTSWVVLVVKNPSPNAGDTRDSGLILGMEGRSGTGVAILSSILADRIPWTEEPGRLQSIASQSQTRLKRCSTHARKLMISPPQVL